MTIDSERNQSGLLSRIFGGMFPESRLSELSVSAAPVVSRLPIALSISLDDIAVDVVSLPGGVFDSEGCEFVAVMVLDASAPFTIEAVVTLDPGHDTGRRHSQWISRWVSQGWCLDRSQLFSPYCGVGRVSIIESAERRYQSQSSYTVVS